MRHVYFVILHFYSLYSNSFCYNRNELVDKYPCYCVNLYVKIFMKVQPPTLLLTLKNENKIKKKNQSKKINNKNLEFHFF